MSKKPNRSNVSRKRWSTKENLSLCTHYLEAGMTSSWKNILELHEGDYDSTRTASSLGHQAAVLGLTSCKTQQDVEKKMKSIESGMALEKQPVVPLSNYEKLGFKGGNQNTSEMQQDPSKSTPLASANVIGPSLTPSTWSNCGILIPPLRDEL